MEMAAIREKIESAARALREQPDRACSRSAPLVARRVDGLRFEA